MTQLDLLDHLNRYPDRAGFKEHTTSKDAADRIEASGTASTLRLACLDALKVGPVTCKELAALLAQEITSIRPRVTELKARGLVEESGVRRDGQHVYQIVSRQ